MQLEVGRLSDGDPFADLPGNHFGAIYADPPWTYQTWSDKGSGRSASQHYRTMSAGKGQPSLP